MVKETEEAKASTIQGNNNDVTEKGVKGFFMKDVMEDIEVHGKTLRLLMSICKVIGEDDLITDDNHAVKSVEYLETVWHSVWLRTLEWECLIEQSLTNKVFCQHVYIYMFHRFLYRRIS